MKKAKGFYTGTFIEPQAVTVISGQDKAGGMNTFIEVKESLRINYRLMASKHKQQIMMK